MKNTKNCMECGKEFERPKSLTSTPRWQARKYCGHKCRGKASVVFIEDQASKVCLFCEHTFYKPVGKEAISNKRWNERRVCSNTCWRALYLSSSDRPNQYKPVATSTKYHTIHHWVNRNFEEKVVCESCGDTKRGRNLHWANISSCYLRERSDWLCLCMTCHTYFDHPRLLDEPKYRDKIAPHVREEIKKFLELKPPAATTKASSHTEKDD